MWPMDNVLGRNPVKHHSWFLFIMKLPCKGPGLMFPCHKIGYIDQCQ